MPQIIKESRSSVALTGSRTEITLITPGWGSSGYYSAAVLEQAAKDRVFPVKTQQHIDHDQDGGVGSVGTLAAALAEDARWEPDWVDPDNPGEEPGRLVAENRVFSHKREMLAEIKDVIGTSIAASAEISFGEAGGRKGQIIERLFPAPTNRVDYVTVAGRGGRISEVLEAAKVKEARNVGMWLEARMHSMFTNISDEMYGDGRLTREERITLSSALGDALASFTAKVEDAAPQLFERDLWEDPTPTAAAEAAAKNVPSNPAGQPQPNDVKETNMGKIEVDESAHVAAVEASGRVPALEAENADLKAKLAESAKTANDATATAVVAEAFKGINAPATVKLLAGSYTLTAEGAVDTAALKARAEEAAAEIAVSFGAGSVRGVGHTATATESGEPADADVLTALKGA